MLGNGQSGRSKVVGEEYEPQAGGDVEELDAAQRFGGGLGRIEGAQQDRLVADQSRRSVHRVGVAAAELEVGLGAGHEQRPGGMESVQEPEIQVSAIHDVVGTGTRNQVVQGVDIVQFPVRDQNKFGDGAVQVE